MEEIKLKLQHPPIVEAVLDIECDLPREQDLVALEGKALNALKNAYPKNDRQLLQQYRIEAKPEASATSVSTPMVQALRFYQEGGKQLVQVRATGYSFNRLAPYTGLDDYLPEIERTWGIYRNLAEPIQVRQIQLRFINRILLPLTAGQVDLDEYLTLGPRLPDEHNLRLAGFFNQYHAVEIGTGFQVKVTLTLQQKENEKLPVIFDNAVLSIEHAPAEDWPNILGKIRALRDLKNRIFRNTLTDTCLELFQTP